MDNAMRASSSSNPRFGPLLSQSLQELAPHGGPEPLNTLAHVTANRSWSGRPIIPDREADRMSMGERLTDPRGLAYAGSQLTGGMLDPHRLSVNPFGMNQHPHQSVEDYYSALHSAENAMAPARRGMRVSPEIIQRFQRLHAIEQAMRVLSQRYRTASPEGQAAIRAQQNALARRALQAAGR
jgi:hypothetical protein